MQPKPKKRFNTHLVIIKVAFCQPKKVGPNEVWLLGLFSTAIFDLLHEKQCSIINAKTF
jgi:hypothetical protein